MTLAAPGDPRVSARHQAVAPDGATLPHDRARDVLHDAFADRHDGQRVLVLIPDHTRSLPLPMLFAALADALRGAREVTFMVALGTHPPLSEERLHALVGVDAETLPARFPHVRVVNHEWSDPDALVSLGTLPQSRVRAIAGARWHPTLGGDVDVRVNRAVVEHDHVIILGPTFPHEVVGYSGGAKYFFPGASDGDMINVTHWLGALAGVRGTIGERDTPVRAMIHAAYELVPTPTTLAALVVEIVTSLRRGETGLDIVAALSMSAALIFGEHLAAAVVALMYAGGQHLEDFAARRARREMTDLLARVPRTAMRHRNGGLEEVPLDDIVPGDRLMIRRGERPLARANLMKSFEMVSRTPARVSRITIEIL